MKHRLMFSICILLAQSGLAQSSVPVPVAKQSPESFIRTPIQHVQRASKADEEAQAGLRGAGTIYTSGLIALMRKDRNSTPRGYVGKLDFGPICDCQDPEGLQLAALAVTNQDATHASAFATMQFPDESVPRTVQFFLLRTAAGWRIDDIKTPDEPSFLKFLQQGH